MLWSFVQSMYKSHYNCVRQWAKPTSFVKLVLFKMVEENTKNGFFRSIFNFFAVFKYMIECTMFNLDFREIDR